jgi:4-amino-4-deoxy-L-arabinose transferase-like glycosyltransferase
MSASNRPVPSLKPLLNPAKPGKPKNYGRRQPWYKRLKRAVKNFKVGQRTAFAILALGMLAIYGLSHGKYGLFDVDEAIFTRATVEMRGQTEEGIAQWAMPSYNAEPRYHKPPLFYWLQATAMQKLSEQSLWAARLPSALSALLCILTVFAGIWVLTRNSRWAGWSAAFLGLSLSFVVIGRAATADAVLNLTILLTVFSVLRLMYGKPWRYGWVITGAAAGLGFLAKGPVAWIIPGIIGLTILIGRGNWKEDWARANPWGIATVAMAVILPWLGLLTLQGGWGFFYEFFVVHNLQRFGPGLSNTQSSSPFYYLVVLLVGFFPMVMLLPVTVRWAFGNLRQRLRSEDLRDALPVIALIYAAVFIVFFSFSGTKLAHYIVPAYSGLAIAVGAWLERGNGAKGRTNPRTFNFIGVWLLALPMAALVAALGPLLLALQRPVLTGWATYLQTWFNTEWPPEDILLSGVLIRPVDVPLPGLLLLAALILLTPFVWHIANRHLRFNKRDWRAWLASALVVWGCALVMVVQALVPTVWTYTQQPLASLAERIRYVPEGITIIHLGLHKPSILYLSGRPFTKVERALQVPRVIPVGSRGLVLTEEADVPKLLEEFRINEGTVTEQACTGGYCLMLVDRVTE